jgi:gliding motility-associated-like protein
MIRYLFLFGIVMTGVASSLYAQNMVPNNSFETGPGVQCGVFATGDFDNSVSDWYSPTAGNPALFSTQVAASCWNYQPNSTFVGPPCLPGPQLPKTGNVHAGITIRGDFGQQQRDYIQIQLSQTMVPGRYYRVAFNVSFADSSQYASSNIGAWFTINPNSSTGDTVMEATPQIEATSIISDTSGWTLIQGEFQASQPSNYITIGNFRRDEDTDSLLNAGYSGQTGCEGSFYYVDDVDVYEICPQLDDIGDQTLCLGDTVTLNTNIPGNYPSSVVEYLWTTGETSSSIEVMDQGFFGVQITVNDTCIIGDTVFVDLDICPPTLDMANVFTPNGDGINDLFRPVTYDRIKEATLMIFDRWGKKVYESNDVNAGWNGMYKTRLAPEGVYFWTVSYRGRSQEFDRESGNLTLMR